MILADELSLFLEYWKIPAEREVLMSRPHV